MDKIEELFHLFFDQSDFRKTTFAGLIIEKKGPLNGSQLHMRPETC